MNLPASSDSTSSAKAPKSALFMIVAILVALLAVAVYSNVQRWRRDKIETVIVTPVATPAPASTSSP